MNTFSALSELSPTLSVGIVSADLLNLGEEISRLEKTEAKVIHFDVMDGCFAPSLTVGVPFIKAIKTTLIKDVHLMIQDPLEKVESYAKAGADILTFHAESCQNPLAVLERITELKNANDPERKILRGIALNPDTSIDTLTPLLDKVDIITLLAVDPTQKVMKLVPMDFMEKKCGELKSQLSSKNKNPLLCIDGGVKQSNLSEFAKLEADLLVSGSALFKDGQLEQNISSFLEIMRKTK